MKAQTKIVGGIPTRQDEINWDEPQYLISKNNEDIVLSTGTHTQSGFSAIKIISVERRIGIYADNWDKSSFTPITSRITIEISNV